MSATDLEGGEAVPDPEREEEEAVPAVRSGTVGGTTGSARRRTGGVADDLVSGTGRVAGSGAGVTRGPVGPVAMTGELMRCTGRVPAPSPGSSSPGDATGSERDGSSSPEAGRAVGASTPLTSPPGAPSRTACDSVPVKEGFCQVVSRPPNPASATEPLPAVAR
ncbi:hypothetical protein ACWGDT_18585 [Streptomyces avermitilis]